MGARGGGTAVVGLPLQLTRALGQLFFWNLSSSRLAQHGRSQRGAVKSNRVNHFLCLWCPHLRRKDCVDALGRTTVGSGQFPINSTLRCPITSRGSILACVSCRTGSQQSQQMGACRCGPAPPPLAISQSALWSLLSSSPNRFFFASRGT